MALLITDKKADVVNVIYHEECSPEAIMELRRYTNAPLQLKEVSTPDLCKNLKNNMKLQERNQYNCRRY